MSHTIPHDEKERDALRTIYDGLKMALDGAYTWACLRKSQANNQGETSRPATETRPVPIPIDKRELSVKELAALWGVSERSIYQWKTTGGLPFKKRGRLLRFDPIKVDQWEKGRQELFTKARLRVVK
jgi:excisionase family DNA binding protein